MNTRIKLFIGFLAFIAVISVVSFSDVFKLAKSDILEKPKQDFADPEADTDHDGLSNIDESYWNTDFENPDTDGDGFLDGEEVASRHDPTKPGPDDALANINITQRVANLAISGLAEGSLNPNNAAYNKSIDTLTLSVMDDAANTFTNTFDISQLKIINSTITDQENYLIDAGSVWELFFKVLLDEGKNIESKIVLINNGGMRNPKYIEYFITKRDEFNLITKQWLALSVPKNWVQEHTVFLNLISGLAQANDALARGADDPIRAAMGFEFFIDLVDSLPESAQIYIKKAQQENLSNTDAFK